MVFWRIISGDLCYLLLKAAPTLRTLPEFSTDSERRTQKRVGVQISRLKIHSWPRKSLQKTRTRFRGRVFHFVALFLLEPSTASSAWTWKPCVTLLIPNGCNALSSTENKVTRQLVPTYFVTSTPSTRRFGRFLRNEQPTGALTLAFGYSATEGS